MSTSSPSRASFFHRILLPPIVLQSLIMGGGYSTGREVVEYAGRFGRAGWLSTLVILVGFVIVSILCFEVARIARAYDYKRWVRELIGPLWPLFDLLALTMMLLVIAVMAAAMSSILSDTVGIPSAVGLGIAFAVVGVIAYGGEELLERVKTVGSVALYVGYASFALLVLSRVGSTPTTVEALPSGDTRGALLAGVIYVAYNMLAYPGTLFCLHRQDRRSDSVLSGILSGFAMTVPFALTLACLLRVPNYGEVVAAEVPWLVMLQTVGGGAVVAIFGVVAGWTLIETAVGSIHALVNRLDKNLEDLPDLAVFAKVRAAGHLGDVGRVVLSVGILAAATLLAQIGIIDLVARGYTYLAYGFIVLLLIPLLTVGLVKVARSR